MKLQVSATTLFGTVRQIVTFREFVRKLDKPEVTQVWFSNNIWWVIVGTELYICYPVD